MLTYPAIDPVAFALPSFELPLVGAIHIQIHWYGIMYLVGFVSAWWLGRYRARQARWQWAPTEMDDLVFYTALGVVIGGRLGSVLFYNFPTFLANPLSVFAVWNGGMAFHGGLIGVMVATWLFARHKQKRYFQVLDFVAPLVPIGLGAGRIGNFINGELWGKPTDLPWAMAFPAAGPLPRHPSQLYEFLLEGVVLFSVLWLFSRRPRPLMAVSGLFAVLYALFRIMVEFVRLPDAHIGYLAFGWLTMGQLLSLPLLMAGLGLLWAAYRRPGIKQLQPVS